MNNFRGPALHDERTICCLDVRLPLEQPCLDRTTLLIPGFGKRLEAADEQNFQPSDLVNDSVLLVILRAGIADQVLIICHLVTLPFIDFCYVYKTSTRAQLASMSTPPFLALPLLEPLVQSA
jgi:hypothetical protein